MAIGSRYVPGGRTENWPLQRQLISRGGNLYSRILLGTGIHDITGGFRAYRDTTLRALDLDSVQSRGYCFQIDMTYRVVEAGFRVAEVPIVFVERELGESKMSKSIITEAFTKVAGWGFDRRGRQLRRLLSKER